MLMCWGGGRRPPLPERSSSSAIFLSSLHLFGKCPSVQYLAKLCPLLSQATWLVHRALMQKLREMKWKDDLTMLDFYEMYYVPFGELLTDMER